MDILDSLCLQWGVEKNIFGISGLKDKKAVTRQWITVRKNDLEKI